MADGDSLFAIATRRFFRDRAAIAGIVGVLLLLIPALYAPFIANGRPLFMLDSGGHWSFPFFRSFFAPDSTEVIIEQIFNYFALFLPVFFLTIFLKHRKIWRLAAAGLLLIPFLTVRPRIDKQDYRELARTARFALFAPIPYGPFEMTAPPFEGPSPSK